MRPLRYGFLALVLGLAHCLATSAGPAPLRLVFDTDLGNDCDDALALALVHALQNRGACELVAVTLSNPDPLAGELVDAINTFYGRGDIPIGVNPAAPASKTPSAFLPLAKRYPHDFNSDHAPQAVAVLRRALASAEDGGITMIQVGFFTNLAALLDSRADDASPLPGRELVARKVRLLALMGGAFAPIYGKEGYAEFNVKFDVGAARLVAGDWPTPTVWSGKEVGLAVLFPADCIDHDFTYVRHHPVQESYQLYKPTPHERPCYDLTPVLQAVWPSRGLFDLSSPGTIEVAENGAVRFQPDATASHRYLKLSSVQAARVRGLLAALVSEPPKVSQ